MSVLHEGAQAAIQHLVSAAEDDTTDGAIVTSWVIVAEVLTSDGDRRCCLLSGDPNGGDLPEWTRDGLLTYALNFPTEDDE